MTIGGTANKKFVKIYSLNFDYHVPACLESLNDLPDERLYAAGGALGGKKRKCTLFLHTEKQASQWIIFGLSSGTNSSKKHLGARK